MTTRVYTAPICEYCDKQGIHIVDNPYMEVATSMPTEKSPEVEQVLTNLTGISRQTASKLGICTWCKGDITGFKDELSAREYRISGFCQECQDKTFGEDDEIVVNEGLDATFEDDK